MPTDYNKYGVLRSEGMIVGPNNSYAIVFDDQDGFRIVRAPFSSAPEEVVAYDSGGAPGLLVKVIDVSSDQLRTLVDTPLVLVEEDPRYAYVVHRAAAVAYQGSIPCSDEVDVDLYIGAAEIDALDTDLDLMKTVVGGNLTAWVSQAIGHFSDDASAEEWIGPIITDTESYEPNQGGIDTFSISDGGADYVVGDTFTVDGGIDGFLAAGVVTAVSSGAVTAAQLTAVGAGYVEAAGIGTTATSGIGTGLEIDIESLHLFNSTARIWLTYQKIPVTA